MRTIQRRLAVLAYVVFSVAGCGQGDSSAGVVERGDGPPAAVKTKVSTPSAPPQTASVAPGATQGIGRTMALSHTIVPGRAVRWPSRTVSISTNAPFAKNAAHLWVQQGFRFRMGTGKQIVYMGYATYRNAVGWSDTFYRGGKITHCRIWLNPRYFRRYDPTYTFAHEIGHCLGLTKGHVGTRGNLMSRYGGRKIAPQTAAMFNYLYSVKPGAKL